MKFVFSISMKGNMLYWTEVVRRGNGMRMESTNTYDQIND